MIFIVIALAGGYLYSRNPAGCAKLVADLGAFSNGGFDKFKADLGPALTAPASDTFTNSETPPVSSAIDKTSGAGDPSTNAPAAVPPASPPKPVVTFAPSLKRWTPCAIELDLDHSGRHELPNVVVTKIGPETVSITHSMGVAHDIPIAGLSPDIQKQLNYNPIAAAAARKETAREEAHPYYLFADRTQAQDVARQLNWPLAWMSGWAADLTYPNPPPNSEQDLNQRALKSLTPRAVVIFRETTTTWPSCPTSFAISSSSWMTAPCPAAIIFIRRRSS